jgi:hypothetical protein
MENGKTVFEKAMRRTAELGDTVLVAHFRDQATLMKVISQLPYVELDPPHVTERAGTACQGISNVRLKDGTMGFTLVTGGDLTSEEIDTAVDLLDKYGEEQIFATKKGGEKSFATATKPAKPKRGKGLLIVMIGLLILAACFIVLVAIAAVLYAMRDSLAPGFVLCANVI